MRRVFYTYNTETDDFERYYPTVGERLKQIGSRLGLGLAIGAVFYFVAFYMFDSPTEANLREENRELKEQYAVLNHRLDVSLNVMEDIRKRDDNFYRVMMQMDPVGDTRRYAGLDNEEKYRELRKMSDASIVEEVSRNMDLLERELYSQSKSFDELRSQAVAGKVRMAHIPQIIPLDYSGATIASGFGYRRKPGYGVMRFHSGIDFAAKPGTPVLATADGTVKDAGQDSQNGNYIVLDHGYEYHTRYNHLSQINVKAGDRVKRGDQIGKVGNSGRSMGPHLHYEVQFKGEPQNPVDFFFMDLSADDYQKMIQTADNNGYVMD